MSKKWTTPNTVNKIVIPSKDLVSPVIKQGKDEILENLNSISKEDIDGISNDIECQRIIFLLENNKWIVTEEDLDLLMGNWYLGIIWRKIWQYNEYIQRNIAIKLINKAAELWRPHIWKYLEHLSVYDNQIALTLIKCGYEKELYDHIDAFKWLSKEVAIAIYDAIWETIPLRYLNNDREEVILYYIEKWEDDINLSNNIIHCDLEFANKILKVNNKHKYDIICRNISCFPSEIHKEIALTIIKDWWAYELLTWLSRFEWMDLEIAVALWEQWYFTTNLKKYNPEARTDIALYLLDKRELVSLEDVNKLNLDFANKLIERGKIDILKNNIQYFFERDHKAIALSLLNNWYYLKDDDLKKFKWKDKELILALFDFISNNDSLKESNAKQELCEYIAYDPTEFTWLDDDIATILIDMWYWERVKKYKNLYKNLSTYTKMRLLMK